MYRLVFWYKWRVPLLCVFVALAVAVGLWQGIAMQPTVAASAAADMAVRLPIIMYHAVLDDTARLGRYVISPTQFEEDLQYIRRRGYTTVVMADVIRYVEEGVPLPEKPVLLTFDDGYYNNYLFAYPLLQAYGMKAVVSPVCKWTEYYSDTPAESDHAVYSHITWVEMREMVASGLVEIQNHSYDMHYTKSGKRKGTLRQAGESEEAYKAALRQDLTAAQMRLTDYAGVTPTTFVYPYGAICQEARAVVKEMGFRASFSCEGRMNYLTDDPACLFGLGRYIRPSGQSSQAYFDPIFRAAEE